MAMIKADAYGHGLLRVARTLENVEGLAVARLQEALVLRRAGIRQRILLLSTLLSSSELAMCSERHIDVTAHDSESVARIAAQARETPIRVWLKLDSGMHRAGLHPEAFVEADRLLSSHPGVVDLVHMTHFSHATDPMSTTMEQQIARFRDVHRASSAAETSLANSAALIARYDTHADWVRPGITLYGCTSLAPAYDLPLRAAMRLSAHIVAVRHIEAGESVGYDGRWISARRSRIGTVGIGYGDGYPRHARDGTPVWINGQLVPLVGRVSMDSLTIDLTNCERATVGDEVVLWGAELPAAAVAEHAETISYQLFTSVQRRVTREYVDVRR